MKTKSFDKKLSLGKQTIAQLRNDEMNRANGAGTIPGGSCLCTDDPEPSFCLVCTGRPCSGIFC